LTISRKLQNVKVISQSSRSQNQIFGFFITAGENKKFVSKITGKAMNTFA